MTARDEILGRIREALRAPAPAPGQHGLAIGEPRRADAEARQWLPPAGANAAEWTTRFAAQAEMLKATFALADDEAAAREVLRGWARDLGWKKVACHGAEPAASLAAALDLPALRTDAEGGYDVHELERCDAGITTCECLIAQTGSVLLTARSSGGRALSVLPPHHIVVARRGQIVPDLPAAYALLHERHGTRWPSMMTLVTGPSRTGDIERILVLGAHGPKRLSILVF